MIVNAERVDWAGFTALPPRLLERPTSVSREEAWSRHRERLQLLPERSQSLRELAQRNGVEVGERGHRDCASLESWVYGVVMAHGALQDELDAPVLSLVHDAGMVFGDEQIARYPTLSWQMRRGSPRNLVYHYTVIMGFTKAKGYEAEPVFSYMLQLAEELKGDKRRPRWTSIVERNEEYA